MLKFSDCVTWGLKDYIQGLGCFQSFWVQFQMHRVLSGTIHYASNPLLCPQPAEVRNSGPFLAHVCPWGSENWENGRSRCFQGIQYFGLKKKKMLKGINLKLTFHFDRLFVDPRLSAESPSQPQYNCFNWLGILFLSHSNVMIWTFTFSQSPSTY